MAIASAGASSWTGVRGGASASAGIGKNGPQLNAKASTFVGNESKVHGKAQGNFHGVTGSANGNATVQTGVGAHAGSTLNRNGLTANAGSFAGARSAAHGSAAVNGLGVTGRAEGWAGAGVEANASATNKNGKLTVKFGIGAALGVGGKVGAGFTIDHGKIKRDMEKAGKAIDRDFKKAGNSIKSGFNSIGKALGF